MELLPLTYANFVVRRMKGQISLESLFLLSISLALLSISLFALFQLRDYSLFLYQQLLFRNSVDSISQSASEVCALGDGNSRMVFVSIPLELSQDGDAVKFSINRNNSIVKGFRCNLKDISVHNPQLLNGSVIIKNKDGFVELTQEQ